MPKDLDKQFGEEEVRCQHQHRRDDDGLRRRAADTCGSSSCSQPHVAGDDRDDEPEHQGFGQAGKQIAEEQPVQRRIPVRRQALVQRQPSDDLSADDPAATVTDARRLRMSDHTVDSAVVA